MSRPKITIAICTYNGESRLPKVFEYLSKQENVQPADWEILVIDNASKDGTSEVVLRYQESLQNLCEIRYVVEEMKGLAFARSRAVKESNGDLVAFVDDDNLLLSNWVEKALGFAELHPKVAAFGGRIHGKFESKAPPYLKKIGIFLAIIERGDVAHRYPPEKRMLPPGAGLVVRKQVWSKYVPDKLSLAGRVGESMLSGEDLEALVYMQKAGWEIWYNPEMELFHDIPQHRLDEKYLLKLAWGTGLSRHYIRSARYSRVQAVCLTPLHILYDAIKLANYYFEGLFKSEKAFIEEFELMYRLGTFMSTFYFFKTKLSKFIM